MIEQVDSFRSATATVRIETTGPVPHGQIPRLRTVTDRGAALTEFAPVFPIMLLIFVFMIDFGRAYILAKAIDNAVAQGAYRASTLCTMGMTNDQWAAAVEQTARQSLTDHSWNVDQRLTVIVPIPSTSNGMVDSQGIRIISVKGVYQANHLLTLPGLPAGYLIDRTVRMDQLR